MSIQCMDEGDIAAIAIYNSTDKDQVLNWVAEDPSVTQGVLTYELLSGSV